MEEYEILEIYREITRKGTYDFKMFLFDGKNIVVRKASRKMRDLMKKGRFYKHDWICVEGEDEGIVFRLIDPRSYSYTFMHGKEFNSEAYLTIKNDYVEIEDERPGKRHKTDLGSDVESSISGGHEYMSGKILLPFLNDTLPYSPLSIPIIDGKAVYSERDGLFSGKYLADSCEYVTVDEWYCKGNPLVPVIGRVGYKTRMGSISYSRKYPYYFFILLTSSSNFLKVIVWGEDLPYSSMRVGDVIGLKMYRKKNPVEGVGIIEYNRFTEAMYFKCKEVSAKKIFRIQLERNGEMPESIFNDIAGEVEYLSVLTRRYSGCLEEYHLIRIRGAKILLFYNSSREFYKIEAGRYIKITNLRVAERGKSKFYISTIYTQIESQEGNMEHKVKPSKANKKDLVSNSYDKENSMEGVEISIKGEELLEDGCRSKALDFGTSSDEDSNGDSNEFHNASFEHGILRSIPTMNSEDSMITIQPSFVFGAIGYVPDDFSTAEEMSLKRKEKINGKEYEIGLFMVPFEVSLKDLSVEVEKMVLSESKKYLVEAVLSDVDFSNFIFDESPTLNDGTVVNYSRNGVQVQQSPAYIRISDDVDLTVCLFNNFWTDDCGLESLYKLGECSSLEEFKRMKGERMKFIVDAFRASEDTVLFYLTKIFK